jgi:oligosaccharide repeat unit polymerase
MTWILCVLMVVVAVIAHAVERRALSPGPFFAWLWAATTTMATAVFGTQYTRPEAVAALLVGVILFAAGAGIAVARRRPGCGRSLAAPGAPEVHRRWLEMAAVMGAAAGLLATGFVVTTNGLAIDNLSNATGFLEAANTISVNRYSGEMMTTSVFIPPLLGIAYGGALASPFLLLTDGRFRRTLVVAPLAALMVHSAVTTARLAFILGTCMAIAGYIAMRVVRDGSVPVLRLRVQVIGAIGIVGVIGMSWLIGMFRLGHTDSDASYAARQKLTSYIVASIPAFAQWFPAHALQGDDRPLTWGADSIAGVSLLQNDTRLLETRAYGDFVFVSDSGIVTNVYTMYRGLIQDFGLPGTVLVLFAMGWATGRAYVLARERRTGGPAAVMACMYTIVLLSTIQSVVMFTVVVGAMAMAVVVVRLAVHAPRPVPLSSVDSPSCT